MPPLPESIHISRRWSTVRACQSTRAAGSPGARQRSPPATQRLGACARRYDRATAELDPPLAIVDLGAFDRERRRPDPPGRGPPDPGGHQVAALPLPDRARPGPPGYQGVMCYSLPEALWLHAAGTSDDLLVAYPTVDRRGAAGAGRRRAGPAAHHDHGRLDRRTWTWWTGPWATAIRRSGSAWTSTFPGARWPGRPAVHIGTRRSPLLTPRAGGGLRPRDHRRPGFRLVGVMGYEGQIAGLGDAPPGHPVRARLIRQIQARSARGAGRAPDRGGPPDPGPDQPGVRERRRHRQPGVDRGGRVGDRADRGLRTGRPDPVRRLPPVHPRTRAAVRAARGAPARPGHRHLVLRRLRGLRAPAPRTGCRGRTCRRA